MVDGAVNISLLPFLRAYSSSFSISEFFVISSKVCNVLAKQLQ